MKKALEFGADIVECNIYSVFDDIVKKYNDDKHAVYKNNQEVMTAYIKDYHIKTVVWNKIYKKTLIDNILFEYKKYNEDEFFTYKALSNVNVLVHLDEYFYYYRQRNDSIMGSSFSLKNLDSLEAAVLRHEFIKANYGYLSFYTLNTTTLLCIFHYQNLLKNKSIDKDKRARNRIKKYRKRMKWSITDLKRVKFSMKIFVLISGFSLSFCAYIRNLLKIGE